MRSGIIVSVVLVLSIAVNAQSDLDKLVATERAFASLAAEKGTKTAFLENIAADGVLFLPDKINGRAYWNSRPESTGLLSWSPNFADVSSNGILGYTTGNWEYRAKGKGDEPGAFGEFVTIWLRQPDGRYRFVIDIGVGHPKPTRYSEDLSPPSTPSSQNSKSISAADSANRFFEVAATEGLGRAYSTHASPTIRFFREGVLPGLGKKGLEERVKKEKGSVKFPKRSVFFESADLAYVTNTYTFASEDGKTVSGNFMQVWKLVNGKWMIVLDIFKPVPEKTS